MVCWRRCNLTEEVPYTRLYSACTILTITCLHKPGTGTSLNGKNMAHFSFPIGTCLSSIDFLTTVPSSEPLLLSTDRIPVPRLFGARGNLPIFKECRVQEPKHSFRQTVWYRYWYRTVISFRHLFYLENHGIGPVVELAEVSSQAESLLVIVPASKQRTRLLIDK